MRFVTLNQAGYDMIAVAVADRLRHSTDIAQATPLHPTPALQPSYPRHQVSHDGAHVALLHHQHKKLLHQPSQPSRVFGYQLNSSQYHRPWMQSVDLRIKV